MLAVKNTAKSKPFSSDQQKLYNYNTNNRNSEVKETKSRTCNVGFLLHHDPLSHWKSSNIEAVAMSKKKIS